MKLRDYLSKLKSSKVAVSPPTPYLVTVLVTWSKSPYSWTSPYDKSGDYEDTLRLDVDDADLLTEEELKIELVRIARLDLEPAAAARELSLDGVKLLSYEKI